MLTVTPIYAGLLGLWFLTLSARVILRRRAAGVSLGAGEDRTLERRIRAHGNFAEYAPLCLFLLAVLEIQGGAAWLLHVSGGLLLLGRLLHGYSLSFSDYSPLRVPGMALTLTSLGLLSLATLGYAFA